MTLVGVPGKAEVTMQQASRWTLASSDAMTALCREPIYKMQPYSRAGRIKDL